MPGYLWSNPTPSDFTLARAQSEAKILGPDTGHIVAAIMQMRDNAMKREQEQKEQEQKSIMQVVGSIAGGIGKIGEQQGAGQLADFERIGLTDQSDALMTPAQEQLLSSMQPQERLKAMSWLQQTQNASQKEDNNQALLDARINEMQSRSDLYNRKGFGNETSGSTSTDDRRDMLNMQDRMNAIRAELAADIGVPKGKLDPEMAKLDEYHPGETAFPALGVRSEISDASQGDYKGRVLDARQRYLDLARQISGAGTPPTVSSPAQLPTPSLPEGHPAPGYGDVQYPDGVRSVRVPGATSSATTPQRSGAGPTQGEIAALQAHPEAATLFDQKFGQGAAAMYLGN